MIVARVTQYGDVGKTTPASHFASQSFRQGKEITPIYAGPRGCGPIDLSNPRPLCRPHVRPHRLARDRRIAKLSSPSAYSDHIVTDGPSALCRPTKIVAFQRGVGDVDMPRDLPARQFPTSMEERS